MSLRFLEKVSSDEGEILKTQLYFFNLFLFLSFFLPSCSGAQKKSGLIHVIPMVSFSCQWMGLIEAEKEDTRLAYVSSLKLKHAFASYNILLQSVSQILINEVRWLFSRWFWTLLNRVSFFEAAWELVKIEQKWFYFKLESIFTNVQVAQKWP